MTRSEKAIRATQLWLEKMVIGLNLCPFAKKEYVKNRIRYKTTSAESEEDILQLLLDEFNFLIQHDELETTLLILLESFTEFNDYNQFLELSDVLIEEAGLSGIFQIASFHPDYQFEGSQKDDVENYTNRSPYPMLHILREASLEYVIDSYSEVNSIPENNVRLLRSMGVDKVERLLDEI